MPNPISDDKTRRALKTKQAFTRKFKITLSSGANFSAILVCKYRFFTGTRFTKLSQQRLQQHDKAIKT